MVTRTDIWCLERAERAKLAGFDRSWRLSVARQTAGGSPPARPARARESRPSGTRKQTADGRGDGEPHIGSAPPVAVVYPTAALEAQ